jgi:hypothetical protein
MVIKDKAEATTWKKIQQLLTKINSPAAANHKSRFLMIVT